MSGPYPEKRIRRLITASVMAATVMNSLDTTIANVALPHIQGSLSASADEISWVLTSYIVAAAIFTPLAGWLAGRIGRKRLMLGSVLGFVIASILCGAAQSFVQLVGFRLLQGMFGAALVPMSQAILLDINPPENHGSAMSIWSMGAVLGPIIGPSLGGWLTDNMNWRWVFFINVPIGLAALAGLYFFFSDERRSAGGRFDFLGFGTLGLAIGSLQLMLDRGQTRDWFSATEICVEAGLCVLFFYMFIVHTVTAKNPFVSPALFKDRNFILSSAFGFIMGVALFGVLSLLPTMLEQLMNYPVVLAGLAMAPRGVGSMAAMGLSGILMRHIDPRVLLTAGFGCLILSLYLMTGFSLQMDTTWIIGTGIIQGLGTGFVFVPLSVLAFGTLDSRLRNEGAAIFTLTRNMGSAIGISVLQATTIRLTAIVHSRLVEGVRPDNPVMAQAMPGLDFTSPTALARLDAGITSQASMVSYIDAFWALLVLCVVLLPAVIFIRKPRPKAAEGVHVHMD
jgi:DHA2 family multidrug resistance protein